MQKSAAAFRTISEVGEVLDVPAHVLRFWESKFTQIKPVKRGGGRRYYRPEDVGLIRGIQHLLYEQGMTIKGAQKIMSERGVKPIIAMGSDLLANGESVAKTVVERPTETPIPATASIETAKPALSKTELQAIFDQMRHMHAAIDMNLKTLG